ncbi:MAG: PTS sugar transporter subunit IIA [Thermodesulfobacteriota bacterium]
MRLTDVLSRDNVISDLGASEKRELLDEMASDLCERVGGLDREKLLEMLLEREKLGSTGIGHGVAIPHGKIKGIEEVLVAFGRSRKGVDFNSMDDKPVHLFFMIVAPENSTAVHLKVLASISRLLRDSGFRKRLIKASSGEEIYRIIAEEDERLNSAVRIRH